MKKVLFLFLTFASDLAVFAQQNVALQWNSQPFQLQKQQPLNDSISISISQFKVYIQGSQIKKESQVFLIDAEDENSLSWAENQGQLQIGLDPSIQVSGAFNGVLDPINGMYWAWNTGFITIKCVGDITNNKTKQTETFELHLGGYEEPFACQYRLPGEGETLVIEIGKWLASYNYSELAGLHVMQPSTKSKALFDRFKSHVYYAP
ncbi:MAG: hypothetical protein RLZZ65_521 [Bacteroidota bacterium]|jgi:hypothetical protein